MTFHIDKILTVFILAILASIFAPSLVIVLLVINIIAVLFLSGVQIYSSLFSRFEPHRKRKSSYAFVSVLIPTYNEPPALLMHTLEALSQLHYNNFEVIVIDNNTSDPAIWRPIESFVKNLGEKFRFLHVEKLQGFKAGALNYAMELINPKSQYVAVIDADYAVDPEFLKVALSYFTNQKIALVQFPQQYRNCTGANQPIADEYRHFFKVYMNMANYLDCVPSTGTVSVYRLKTLKRIGGFQEKALTEDADAGLRLYGAGYNSVYADYSIGYGLMPYDIEAYRKQKTRWATGNAQSVKTLFGLYGKIPFKSWLGFLVHLTAWDHFNLLPFAVVAAYSITLIPGFPTTILHHILFFIAALSIIITLASKLILFTIALRKQKRFFLRALKACIVHMGMTLVYSEALGVLIFGTKSGFDRTNKFILPSVPSLIKNSYKELFLGIWFLVGAFETTLWGGSPIATIVFLICSLTLLSLYYVYWKILPTKAYSKTLITELENKYSPYLDYQTYEYSFIGAALEKNPA